MSVNGLHVPYDHHPAPDLSPLCVCGHPKSEHSRNLLTWIFHNYYYGCQATVIENGCQCDCREFHPAPPAPVTKKRRRR